MNTRCRVSRLKAVQHCLSITVRRTVQEMARWRQHLIDDEKLLKNLLKAGQTLGLICTSFISSNVLMSLVSTYNGAGISSTKKGGKKKMACHIGD